MFAAYVDPKYKEAIARKTPATLNGDFLAREVFS
jgi:hypothetical protein